MNPAKKDATEAVYRAICRSSVLDPTLTDGKIYVRGEAMNQPITLALICEILNHSIHDAEVYMESGYIHILCDSQHARISLDFIRKD